MQAEKYINICSILKCKKKEHKKHAWCRHKEEKQQSLEKMFSACQQNKHSQCVTQHT